MLCASVSEFSTGVRIPKGTLIDLKICLFVTVYDRGKETYGSSCYRLLSKTGQFIYLRTHGYLEYDKDTQKIVSFICINTLVP